MSSSLGQELHLVFLHHAGSVSEQCRDLVIARASSGEADNVQAALRQIKQSNPLHLPLKFGVRGENLNGSREILIPICATRFILTDVQTVQEVSKQLKCEGEFSGRTNEATGSLEAT